MNTPTTGPAPRSAGRRPLADAMSLLSSGVPLSLLLDLAMGPHSRELLAAERLTATVPPTQRRSGPSLLPAG